MNREAYEIRIQINQLKERLSKIEGENLSDDEKVDLCASTTCGHDVVLENLKKLCYDYDLESLAVMAGWERREGKGYRWYSTNVSPKGLPYFLQEVLNIIHFLSPVMKKSSLEILQYLLQLKKESSLERIREDLGMGRDEAEKTLDLLFKHEFVEEDQGLWQLTIKGWQTFVVLGHLTFVLDLKLPPKKAIPISKAFLEALGKKWGDPIHMEVQEVIEKLREGGWMERLEEEGLSTEDIAKAIYESNAPQ